jgi:hypothetical protein
MQDTCGWCFKYLNEDVGVVNNTYCLLCDGGRTLNKRDFLKFGKDNFNYNDIDIEIKLAILMDDHLNFKRLPTHNETKLYKEFLLHLARYL